MVTLANKIQDFDLTVDRTPVIGLESRRNHIFLKVFAGRCSCIIIINFHFNRNVSMIDEGQLLWICFPEKWLRHFNFVTRINTKGFSLLIFDIELCLFATPIDLDSPVWRRGRFIAVYLQSSSRRNILSASIHSRDGAPHSIGWNWKAKESIIVKVKKEWHKKPYLPRLQLCNGDSKNVGMLLPHVI